MRKRQSFDDIETVVNHSFHVHTREGAGRSAADVEMNFYGPVGQYAREAHGTTIHQGSAGAAQPDESSEHALQCPQCGQHTWRHTRHCVHCGVDLRRWWWLQLWGRIFRRRGVKP
ncbi:MAG: hypothetical protein KIT60_06925 [Burkholderiaceae bacterium]|nr:hypothetical protein [Burkholderiaceae bacterium]